MGRLEKAAFVPLFRGDPEIAKRGDGGGNAAIPFFLKDVFGFPPIS